jgi:hypothetical protein
MLRERILMIPEPNRLTLVRLCFPMGADPYWKEIKMTKNYEVLTDKSLELGNKENHSMDERTEIFVALGAATAANCDPCFEYYLGTRNRVLPYPGVEK